MVQHPRLLIRHLEIYKAQIFLLVSLVQIFTDASSYINILPLNILQSQNIERKMMEIRVEEDNIIELHDASAKGCTVTLYRLIHKDPHIFNKISLTSFNETPLHVSALLGHVDFTKALLALKPQLALDLDFQKRCPLHLASANGHIEIVHALLSANDDACLVCDQDGRIPLHYAVMRGKDEVVKELILAKPDSIRVVFNGGETVLHLCVKYNQLETLKLLVEAVSDDEKFLNSKDHDGGNC